MRLYLLFLLFILPYQTFSASSLQDTSRLSLIFAGDLMGHDEQIFSAWDSASKQYCYDTCFSMIREYTSSADIAFLNLEVTLAGPPFKGYPQFSSPDALAIAAQKAGFDIFLTANNHSLDRGKRGLERTIAVMDSIGIIHTGTFADSAIREQLYPLIIEKNDIRLAVLNYSYGTNGLKVSFPNIVNYIDTSVIAADLKKAETADPDFIIVTLHWGLEYQRSENNEQSGLADFIFRNGADIIIGSHPHVIQPVKKFYPDKRDSGSFNLVVYSLGNFISNQRERYRNGGLMFGFRLEKTGDKTLITDFEGYPVFVHKPPSGKAFRHFVLVPVRDFDTMVERFSMNKDETEQFSIFKQDTEETLLKEFELKGIKDK